MTAMPGAGTLLLSLLPFAAAALGPLLVSRLGSRAGWVLAIVPAILFVHFLGFVGDVADGERLVQSVQWIPSLGVDFAIAIDGLSLTFALLITGIGTFIVIYSGGYLEKHPFLGRFLSFILLFMGSMLGLVLADDLLSLFVFWELTSITSFLLIGFDHARSAARRAALQALFITGAGGLALLVGCILVRTATGETRLSTLLADPAILADGGVAAVFLVLVLLAAFTKSAQVPFHSWLPNAMEAPTPVSAYLHSATMVKAGVYLLMRMNPAFEDSAVWSLVLPLFGGATFLTGVVLALRMTDLKQILAYTTVASLGLLVLLVGIGGTYALAGAVLYLVAHSFFKGGLFMAAGAIDHETGTRDITRLGGLAREMPMTFAAVVLAALSMAGLPPLIGFVAKEVIYDGLWHAGGIDLALVVAVAGNAVMFAIAAIVLVTPFFGRLQETPKAPHEGPPSLWLGPVTLGLVGLATALLVEETVHFVIAPMTSAIAGEAVDLSSIHLLPTGLKPPVVLTLITIAAGIVLWLVSGALRRAIEAGLVAIGWGPDRGFDQLLGLLLVAGWRATRLGQGGRMSTYVTVVFVVLAVTLVVPMAFVDGMPAIGWFGKSIVLYYTPVLLIAVIGLWIVVVTKSRMAAIISLGVQGTMVALIFMLYGAPDLSFTQFMVETLSVVILALVMTKLDLRIDEHRPRPEMIRDGTIAAVCGLAFGALLIGVVQQPFDPRLSDYFGEYSYVLAHGRNVVNVILVDFRALDTLGEISVVMAAGLAILALMRLRAPRRPATGTPTRPEAEAPTATRPGHAGLEEVTG